MASLCTALNNGLGDGDKCKKRQRDSTAAAEDETSTKLARVEIQKNREEGAANPNLGQAENGALATETEVGEEDEVLIRANPNRFVMFPIQYQKVWKSYKQAEASIWHAGEIDLRGDLKDWADMPEGERFYVKNTLAFFAASDGIVIENLAERFLKEVQLPEARAFYSLQLFIENVHSEVYSMTLDSYIRDPVEKMALFRAIENNPAIRRKAEWALKWITDPKASFALRLLAFACVEGIFFSGSFCSIFWLKKRNLLPGLCKSNEFISRDEGMHTQFACLLYSMLAKKPPLPQVEEMVREAVAIEQQFVCSALPVALIGMSAPQMSQYIAFVADNLMEQLGYAPLYLVKQCPFDFMEMISMEAKTNFFEQRVSEYQKSGVLDTTVLAFNGLDDDF